MAYTIREAKVYSHPVYKVHQAVHGAIEVLEAKIILQDETKGRLDVQFNKTILGKVLGERTQLEIQVNALSSDESRLGLSAYPLDAMGRKLMFGARKGVTQTVLNWFITHLEHRLKL